MQVLSALQSEYPGPHRRQSENGLITDEGVAVDGAFDSDTATGTCRFCALRRWRASVPVIVIQWEEVRPMNAVSAMGAPLQSTIGRLR